MLQLCSLALVAGSKLLFEDVSLSLVAGHRYGLVGANGTGKSSLLRVLSGLDPASDGDFIVPKDCSIGFLKQDQYLHEHEKVVDVVLQGKPQLWQALQRKQKLLESEWTDAVAEKFSKVEETIAHLQGYSAESFAQTLLTGLGIAEKYHFQNMQLLSGGMKIRVLLAQALFSEPDILLLDEPTNHLDLMTIVWLEKYLINNFNGLLIFISHDQDFLNHVATDILDIDYGEITLYSNANYAKFLQEKQLITEQKLLEQEALTKKIAHLQKFVDRFKAKATKARQAQSRVKMIEKLEMPDIKRSSRIAPKFNFKPQRPSGKVVLEINEISKVYGEKFVLDNISLAVKRQQKIAIIGHNGIGKSTLLKIITGNLAADLGAYEWGYETHLGYFAQDHHEQLQQNATAGEWLAENTRNITSQQQRNTLGQMLFHGDDIHKLITKLSGGEAARLLLANLILAQPNVLIMDEPTNHLDIETIDELSKALIAYQGTLILVSHDRHFVSKIANRVIALTEDGITNFNGSYPEFIAKYGADFLNRSWLAVNRG